MRPWRWLNRSAKTPGQDPPTMRDSLGGDIGPAHRERVRAVLDAVVARDMTQALQLVDSSRLSAEDLEQQVAGSGEEDLLTATTDACLDEGLQYDFDMGSELFVRFTTAQGCSDLEVQLRVHRSGDGDQRYILWDVLTP